MIPLPSPGSIALYFVPSILIVCVPFVVHFFTESHLIHVQPQFWFCYKLRLYLYLLLTDLFDPWMQAQRKEVRNGKISFACSWNGLRLDAFCFRALHVRSADCCIYCILFHGCWWVSINLWALNSLPFKSRTGVYVHHCRFLWAHTNKDQKQVLLRRQKRAEETQQRQNGRAVMNCWCFDFVLCGSEHCHLLGSWAESNYPQAIGPRKQSLLGGTTITAEATHRPAGGHCSTVTLQYQEVD